MRCNRIQIIMPLSLTKNYLHITFATKYREPLILKEVRKSLFAYIEGIVRNLNCPPIIVNGVSDHVHILCVLNKTMSMSEFVTKVKSNSSKWIKTQGEDYLNFAWQRGYGAFSVSRWDIEMIKNYIANQEQHHSKEEFQKEYLDLLNENEIEYDEKYLWD